MSIDEFIKVMQFENINTIHVINENCIEEIHDSYEDYEKIQEIEGEWKLIVARRERRHLDEVSKEFHSKEEAIRYFCFYQLERHYTKKYLAKAKENSTISIYSDNFNINNLLNMFSELGIMQEYYSVNENKKNAFVFKNTGHDQYQIFWFDKEGNEIHKTMELDKGTALYAMFRLTYLYYLVDTHVLQMQEKGLLADGITRNDYNVIFSIVKG
ncbi:hypothetical protein EDD66_104270 [Mobilisporobacter senegalensis]|uniref:Uncharacterized protein n=1 Tax=Mobilisporobacter senegalensis TaxID=1329262 RepID=A0A3N1XU25_9FIRM|nr:hypothetical protein [Mobilisporobacter senegalensis]ROR28682.1 hypothetical protein EDD66_104270 [Mobilisporobacter senegalensis]